MRTFRTSTGSDRLSKFIQRLKCPHGPWKHWKKATLETSKNLINTRLFFAFNKLTLLPKKQVHIFLKIFPEIYLKNKKKCSLTRNFYFVENVFLQCSRFCSSVGWCRNQGNRLKRRSDWRWKSEIPEEVFGWNQTSSWVRRRKYHALGWLCCNRTPPAGGDV